MTGFGATLAQWKAVHTLAVSVPARNAYLPRVVGDTGGSNTWQVVMVTGGPSRQLHPQPGAHLAESSRGPGTLGVSDGRPGAVEAYVRGHLRAGAVPVRHAGYGPWCRYPG